VSRAARRGRILVVDDEVNARTALAELLRDEGYEVETAADAFKALGKYADFSPQAVLTDLKMPGMDGIELVRRIGAMPDPAAVIVMTAFGAVQSAVAAMRAGAAEYLVKPLDFDALSLVLARALEHHRLAAEARQLRARLDERFARRNIVGSAPAMRRVFEVIDQVAPSRATVLITGESGTGKELVAAAIHHRSPRAAGPFVKVHCAALAESLLESELFGHERGAFTGAVARRDGRFALADGGTLFLDEIGEISPAIQVKLLRFLQEHQFERVGGDRPLTVDVRVIAATNRHLPQMVKEGRFREDLFYRLDVVSLAMPPLRDRRADIPALVRFFLDRFARDNGKAIETASVEALELLSAYDWPGNVRELENAVERAVVMAHGPQLEVRHLPDSVLASARRGGGAGGPAVPGATLAELERHAILATLEATGGSTSKAAEVLGISVRKIQYKLHEYGMAPRSAVPAVRPPGERADEPAAR
jgi:DNA-binding NtrC family response regulator